MPEQCTLVSDVSDGLFPAAFSVPRMRVSVYSVVYLQYASPLISLKNRNSLPLSSEKIFRFLHRTPMAGKVAPLPVRLRSAPHSRDQVASIGHVLYLPSAEEVWRILPPAKAKLARKRSLVEMREA